MVKIAEQAYLKAEEFLYQLSDQSTSYDKNEIITTVMDLLNYVEQDTHGYICYVIGCHLYSLSFEESLRKSETAKWFNHALNKNPENHYARLYLAHLLFDYQNYKRALLQVTQIPIRYFSSRRKPWQVIQVKALILCCELCITRQISNKQRLSSFIDDISRLQKQKDLILSEILLHFRWAISNSRTQEYVTTSLKWLLAWIQCKKTDFPFIKNVSCFQ